MENKDFLSLDYKGKMDLMKKYAGEKMKENDAAAQVKQDMLLEQQIALAKERSTNPLQSRVDHFSHGD
jgi:hypothetical protein